MSTPRSKYVTRYNYNMPGLAMGNHSAPIDTRRQRCYYFIVCFTIRQNITLKPVASIYKPNGLHLEGPFIKEGNAVCIFSYFTRVALCREERLLLRASGGEGEILW